jgi:hypothetical protein
MYDDAPTIDVLREYLRVVIATQRAKIQWLFDHQLYSDAHYHQAQLDIYQHILGALSSDVHLAQCLTAAEIIGELVREEAT